MRSRKSTDTVQLKLRIREELRRKLEREARKRAVSLNAEMVDRLAASFDTPERVNDALGGDHTAALLRSLAGALAQVESRLGRRWIDDKQARYKAFLAIRLVLSDWFVGDDKPKGKTRSVTGEDPPIKLPDTYWDDSDAMARFMTFIRHLRATGAHIPRKVTEMLDEASREER